MHFLGIPWENHLRKWGKPPKTNGKSACKNSVGFLALISGPGMSWLARYYELV